MTMQASRGDRGVTAWLITLVALVVVMVLWGGFTRLTESGLSMVNWHPIIGAVPPVSDAGWQEAFEAYKQFPEYQKVNRGMDLAEFKFIYLIEYIHRMLGRLLGLVFVIPFAVFWWQGRFDFNQKVKYGALLVLGAAQGLLGWYMVKSGLVDRPDVSQYRLAAHLGAAVLIYAYLLMLIFDQIWGVPQRPPSVTAYRARIAAIGLSALVFLQILAGALVAGLKAGHTYNTWPSFQGAMIPEGLYDPAMSLSANLFENSLTVQFNHRMLGYLLALGVVAFWLWLRSADLPRRAAAGLRILPWIVILQIIIGIATLVLVVPVWLGVLHQAGALAVLGVLLMIVHQTMNRKQA